MQNDHKCHHQSASTNGTTAETNRIRLAKVRLVRVGNSLLATEVAEKLAELPREHQEIIALRIWNQLSFEEIAELTNTPKTTVFRMYTEALQELRRKLL